MNPDPRTDIKLEQAQHELSQAIEIAQTTKVSNEYVVTTKLPRWIRLDFLVTAALATAVGAVFFLIIDLRARTQAQNKTLCALVEDSYAGAVRRQDVLNAAEKVKLLEDQLPPGIARDAVAQVQHIFYLSGTGSATARGKFNVLLTSLGCKIRIQ